MRCSSGVAGTLRPACSRGKAKACILVYNYGGPSHLDTFDLKPDAPEASASRELNLDVVLDIPVTLAMEVGRSRISIRNLLQLNQGSVVELERATGEPLDVYVNGTLIAHGEVVVVNDKFGIRLTDVISPAERIRKLK